MKWLRGTCGGVQLEESPRDMATGECLPGWTLEDYMAYAADPRAGGGRILYARDVQCPLEWRDRLEARLAGTAVSPRHSNNIVNELPEDILHSVPESLRINLGVPGTGLFPSLDLCIKNSMLVYADGKDEAATIWQIGRASWR